MDASHGQPTTNFRDADDGAIWPAQPVQLARGRQPRDALAKTIAYHVSSMEEFETSLREYLNTPPEQPEHTEAQLSFWIGTSFMVLAPSSSSLTSNPPPPPHQLSQQPSSQPHLAPQQGHAPPGYQPANGLSGQYGDPQHAYHAVSDAALALTLPNFAASVESNDASTPNGNKKAEHKVSLSIMEALQPTANPKEKMRKQRAIAKCCVDSIQRIDGYRYSFHNCWNSREDDSFRFSYYCNDSLLNKDRAANGKGAKLGKRATKPVYDCKGVLSIKFSATKSTLDVFYKHVPIHKTYEERAPPPRKDSKRRKFLEEHDPDALQRLASRPRTLKADSEELEAAPKLKKKKPQPEAQKPSNTSLESDLRAQSLRSLLELIQVDPPAPPDQTPPNPPPPPPAQQLIVVPEPPAPQVQSQPPQPRKRPRNSCDVCKAKKTKCDGTRPVCQTCVDKNRDCFYSEPANGEEHRKPLEASNTARHAQAANKEVSELEKMKRELEEAKARIQELESEKRASTTPSQTPQMVSRPQSQPQPQAQPQSLHRPQVSHSQSQHTSQQQQRQQAPPNHRQQLQQLNQTNQRGIRSPQQMAFKLDTQSPQQRLQTPQQPLQAPQQQMQTAQQQLQAAAAQQMQPSQNVQLQAPQTYFAATHANHSPYGTLNRPMPSNGLPAQNPMSTQNPMATQNPMTSQNALATQNNQHLPQTQPQAQPTHQIHASNAGLPPTAPSVDANNPYGRSDFAWPPAAYYGYQNAQQQQQEQWAAQARGSGVFR
ncbi:Nn.00g032770.m01.CDS01 [Neocucurbitaria sp. VM-36]